MGKASALFSSLPCVQIRNPRGIALVITLLMLSVITFLAVALLVLSRTHRDSVTTTTDEETAKAMSEAAVARAQTEMIAHIMAHHDLFNYDYTVSHNAINPGGFVQGLASVTANLRADPRAPVFIRTNSNPAFPADFRFWVDLNRNGRFETNGYLPVTINGSLITNFFNGEPEWIGVPQIPGFHGPNNRFIGRYAYLVLPIGKMLDFNFIHNYAKSVAGGVPFAMQPPGLIPVDGYVRDQGVGSWELNLAALLWDLNLDIYPIGALSYNYVPTKFPNSGYAFDDAYSFLRFRYNANYGTRYPLSLLNSLQFLAGYTPNYLADGIDEYGTAPLSFYPPITAPWPGSYATNYFYNIQDVFNTNKTSPAFVNRLL
ncbi:MAG: hypothetical protein ABSG04_04185, partial [Verrucomicrobiota bacterium]